MGHPDYFIASSGAVWSMKRGKPYRLKHQLDQDGYPHVVLRTGGKAHTIKVQRLVAMHFLGPKPPGLVVCHNNGIKTDCHVGNLRYDTQAANIADKKLHGTDRGPEGETNGMAKLTAIQVLEMRELSVTTALSRRQIAERYGISREQARDIINRKYWRHI